MSNFFGKIKVYKSGKTFKVRVVTQTDDGNEMIDLCTLKEIEQAIQCAESGKSRKLDEEWGVFFDVYVSDEV